MRKTPMKVLPRDGLLKKTDLMKVELVTAKGLNSLEIKILSEDYEFGVATLAAYAGITATSDKHSEYKETLSTYSRELNDKKYTKKEVDGDA